MPLLHAADLRMESPLSGLDCCPAGPRVERLRTQTRQALQR
jgi:hypothetical protein